MRVGWLALGTAVNVCACVEVGGAPNSGGGNSGAGDVVGTGQTVGGGGATGTATTGSGGAAMADGSWERPFAINGLPATVEGDTTTSPTSVAPNYAPCAEGTDEGGHEIVYRVSVASEGFLWARVNDVPGDDVDLDVHLLAAPSPDSCITRADVMLGSPVQPGEYWLVVDSWVDGSRGPLEGAFVLEVGLTTTAPECYVNPISCDGMIPPFVNTVSEEAPGDAGCLPGMARFNDYCVDRYEAMLVEVRPDNSLAPLSPFANPGLADVLALSVEGAVPQGFVTQVQASEACARAGKRLCSNDEWLGACSAGTTFPYGDTRQPGVCNDARDCHPVIQFFESDAAWVWSELAHPCISQLPEGLSVTGAHSGCSHNGVYDMMGNLHEWTADPAGTFRGGFYVDTVVNGPGCTYATTAHNVQHWDYSTGFRCCADAF